MLNKEQHSVICVAFLLDLLLTFHTVTIKLHPQFMQFSVFNLDN